MDKSTIIRELKSNPNTTLRVTVTNPEQITPVGTLYNCTWIFHLTNKPMTVLGEMVKEHNDFYSFQASWSTRNIKQAVETCIEFAETSFRGTGVFDFELFPEKFNMDGQIYILVYIQYAYMPCLVINGN